MNIKPLIRSLCVIGAITTISASANAAPIFFAGNGHYYEHIATTTTWTAARTAALGMTHLGQSGYLATITSAAENMFLATMLTSNDGWIGGTDQAAEGDWKWADGPEAGVTFWNGAAGGSSPTFASWNFGEPNDVNGEDYAHLQIGLWNDLPNISTSRGYFVEYNATVPEPGTLALFALGLAGLGLARRRKAA
ncbi:MAG: PEP-CTERM sorting domain-containing protein [Rhodospirillaceae bacterium]|nr:PEP-CTERM sorting domain-containing protein [Rhodospirillaceae bacterium]